MPIDPISRRYFISNGFDGTLTSIGIAVGAFLSGIPSGITVFQVAAGAAIGLATSGVWSVWEIERAEKMAELQKVESAMLKNLEGTALQDEKRRKRMFNASMSGLGPVLGVLIPASVFLLEGSLLTMAQAAIGTVLIGSMVLFSFGAYMGSISKFKWYFSGARMGLAGIVVALLNYIIPG